ncbi:GtrA family protein [uncultured Thiodictyon sp.]|uniref:GtrA family protein n=1 Tax=uncultured Thiodictyon sp. TaxID=1846217 RepID=UPI0025F468AD|nr:GtrA family protein [uncultured Thiodictyon sp.]
MSCIMRCRILLFNHRCRWCQVKGLIRFLKYASVGGATFIIDLLLLYLFIDYLDIYYVQATALAFGVAVSINYFVSRRFVFTGTLRSVHAGYAIFILIAGAGMVAVTGLMVVFVEVFHLPYFPARIIIAGIVGLWNYGMNLYVNFKVAGKH